VLPAGISGNLLIWADSVRRCDEHHGHPPNDEEPPVKYALLICTSEAVNAARSPEEVETEMADYIAFQEDAGAAILGGEQLYPTTDATTVRVRNGEVLASDGPFAETKEQMGGFYLVDAKDLDEAIDLASKIPGAWKGAIEVRPIREM
jgi:hypothetical protein